MSPPKEPPRNRDVDSLWEPIRARVRHLVNMMRPWAEEGVQTFPNLESLPDGSMYGDDIVYAPRPPGKPTVPLTPGLSLQLKHGDPLRSPWYPRLRPVPPWQQAH